MMDVTVSEDKEKNRRDLHVLLHVVSSYNNLNTESYLLHSRVELVRIIMGLLNNGKNEKLDDSKKGPFLMNYYYWR